MGEQARYIEVLSEHIRRIATTWPALPRSLDDVCADYDLRIVHKDLSGYQAYLTTDETKTSRKFSILLPRKGQGSKYERFCIAHELAHLILLQSFGSATPSDINYWKTENLCDEFARRVLIPDKYVEAVLPTSPLSAYMSLRASNRIASAMQVPWIQAARRLNDHLPSAAFFRLTFVRSRLRIIASTLPKNKEYGRFFKDDSQFIRSVARMVSTSSVNEVRFIEKVPREVTLTSGIPTLVDGQETSICVDHKGGTVPEIRVSSIG